MDFAIGFIIGFVVGAVVVSGLALYVIRDLARFNKKVIKDFEKQVKRLETRILEKEYE